MRRWTQNPSHRCRNMFNPCPTPACLPHKQLHTKPTRRGFITSRLQAAGNSGRLSNFYIVEELNKIPSVADNKCFSITAPLPRELQRSLNLAKGGFQCWRETAINYNKKSISSSEVHAIWRRWNLIFQLVCSVVNRTETWKEVVVASVTSVSIISSVTWRTPEQSGCSVSVQHVSSGELGCKIQHSARFCKVQLLCLNEQTRKTPRRKEPRLTPSDMFLTSSSSHAGWQLSSRWLLCDPTCWEALVRPALFVHGRL